MNVYLISKSKDLESDISKTMQRSGVSYVVTGSGRSQKAYFERRTSFYIFSTIDGSAPHYRSN
jgi:hypothetical protein